MKRVVRSRRRIAFQQGRMEQKQTYNGFPNYETWCVSLWMSNDAESYEYFREMARRIRASNDRVTVHLTDEENHAVSLASALRNQFEEDSPVCGESSVYADLLGAALSEVEWYVIAEDLLDDIAEERLTDIAGE